jgi:protein gp37
LAKRFGQLHWGKQWKFFGEEHWEAPLRWNRVAEKSGVRHRVFCASMCDVFQHDAPTEELRTKLNEERSLLWQLIDDTPQLDWLMLTKRPEAPARLIPMPTAWLKDWPPNVWLGATVESPAVVGRIPELLHAAPGLRALRFLSCEPLLGRVDLSKHLGYSQRGPAQINWVIAGGQSGPKAKPSHPEWFRVLRKQCQRAGIPFFFKQWGQWAPADIISNDDAKGCKRTVVSSLGIDVEMVSVGAKKAGRHLDGVVYDEVPTTTFEE